MRGLAIEFVYPGEQDGSAWIPTEDFPNKVVAIVCDQKFPLARITEAILECPWEDVVWVYRDRDSVAKEAFRECEIDAVEIPLNPGWRVKRALTFIGPLNARAKRDKDGAFIEWVVESRPTAGDSVFDFRREKREFEFMYGCTHVLVFRVTSSDVSKHWDGRRSPRGAITIIEHLPKGAKKK